VDDKDQKIEFWAQQAAMWHDKYKSAMAVESDYHRFKVALERISESAHAVTKEWTRSVAKRALQEADK
jgi:hypothetical protein